MFIEHQHIHFIAYTSRTESLALAAKPANSHISGVLPNHFSPGNMAMKSDLAYKFLRFQYQNRSSSLLILA